MHISLWSVSCLLLDPFSWNKVSRINLTNIFDNTMWHHTVKCFWPNVDYHQPIYYQQMKQQLVYYKTTLHLHHNSPCETDLYFKILSQQNYSFYVLISICWPRQFFFPLSMPGKGNWTLSGCTHIKRIYLFIQVLNYQFCPLLYHEFPLTLLLRAQR